MVNALSSALDLWDPKLHYGAYAYREGEIRDDTLWFCEICPLIVMNYHPEMTLPQYG